jgi:cytochrome P450
MASCPVTDLGSLTSSEARTCPVQFLQRLQAQAPIYLDPVTGFYVLTRYADIAHVGDNPQIFSSQNEILMGRSNSPVADEVHRRFRENGFPEVHTLTTADPPQHTRFRRLVDKVFTPTYVKSLQPMVHAMVDELIDTFAGRGEVELAWDFAYLLPLYIIADQLGVGREDWRRIRYWSDIAVERADAALAPERELECTDAMIEMQQYLISYVRKYRQSPEDNLLSRLTHVEDNGEKFQDGELMSIGHQLMVGGNETTANAILSVMNELLIDPALMARISADHSLIPALTEEVLRMHSPAPNFVRTVKQDCLIGGVPIPKGSTIVLSYMGANYDPAKFENPDKLDIDRKGLRLHLTFGRGLHYCIGHLLAKAEIRIAIEHLLTRLPDIHLSPKHPKPRYVEHAFIHAIDAMHLEFNPVRG